MRKHLSISLAAASISLILTASALAGTVCVYNDSGRDLNLSVVWQGGCSDSSRKVKNGNSHWFSCDGARSAQLRLQWQGYEALHYDFEGLARRQGQCDQMNSLTIRETEFGYKWRVSDGRGW
jgi:hypothetical protein